MLSSAAGKARDLTDTADRRGIKNRAITRKIWLPKFFYDALPYFYVASGAAAFFATIYINEWFWVLPHYLLFSAVCLHLGFIVYRRRHRKKRIEADT